MSHDTRLGLRLPQKKSVELDRTSKSRRIARLIALRPWSRLRFAEAAGTPIESAAAISGAAIPSPTTSRRTSSPCVTASAQTRLRALLPDVDPPLRGTTDAL